MRYLTAIVLLASAMVAACSPNSASENTPINSDESPANSPAGLVETKPLSAMEQDLPSPSGDDVLALRQKYKNLTEPMTLSVFQAGKLPPEILQTMDRCVEETRPDGITHAVCFGLIINTCPEDAFSTADMVSCSGLEFEYWSDRLETVTDRLSELYYKDDQEFGEDGAIEVSLTGMFTSAQEDWYEFRRSSCQLESMRFRGGSMGRVTGSTCMAELTARRVLDLEGQIALFEDY